MTIKIIITITVITIIVITIITVTIMMKNFISQRSEKGKPSQAFSCLH